MTGAGQGATGTVTETTAAGQAHACASLARRRLNEALEYVDKLDAFTLLHPQKVTYPFGTTIPPESHVTHDAHAALLREVEGLKAALDTVRVELGSLIVKPNLRAHPSDIPMDLNEADRECVAKAFNASRDVRYAALSPASGGV